MSIEPASRPAEELAWKDNASENDSLCLAFNEFSAEIVESK